MSAEWSSCTLGDVVRLQRGHDLTSAEQIAGLVPVMGSAGPNGMHNIAKASGPGLVIGRSGASIGRVHFSEIDFWPHNTCLYVTDFLGNSPRFVYYFLQTLNLAGYNSGSAQPSLNRNYIFTIQISIPRREEQDEIASFLKALDDRIALLRETNATLEAIAQALFKSWFVDFDPVRAKAEGRAPEGIDEATAALFPDSFEESELGLVPKGWRVSSLAGVTSQSGGGIQTGPFGSQLHASDYVEDGVPVVMPKDINLRSVQVDSIACVPAADVERLARHKLMPGDIVFSRRGDVERHAFISETEQGWLCGTGCLLVRPGKAWPSATFLSMLLDAPQARTWLVQPAVGATMPNLNTGILGSVPVVLPSNDVLLAFEKLVSVLEDSQAQNSVTGRTVATLCDTLLPRLISGQLRLPQSADSAVAA